MKIKLFDEDHEKDLEESVNSFLENEEIEVIDIKYQVSIAVDHDEQVYCFSALIMYK